MKDRDLLQQLRTEELGVNSRTIEAILLLAVEIAREGREGRKVGTMFVVGDVEEVLHNSTPLILDPLLGHPPEVKHVDDPNMRETVKELAQLDGAFVVSDDGVFLSATRYINATAAGIDLPLGLVSRHMAAASITKHTAAAAIVVSESATVRIFCDGEIASEIIPELWLMQRHGLHGSFGADDDVYEMTVRKPPEKPRQQDDKATGGDKIRAQDRE